MSMGPFIIGSIPKLSAKHAAWLMPFFLSCFMSGLISLINYVMNVGIHPGFLLKWGGIWMLSWAIAYPVVLVVLPIVRKITGLIVNMPG